MSNDFMLAKETCLIYCANVIGSAVGFDRDVIRTSCKTPRCRYVKYICPTISPLPNIRIDDPQPWKNVRIDSVSYTHLTLPTILLV